jgi:hypothetical protein
MREQTPRPLKARRAIDRNYVTHHGQDNGRLYGIGSVKEPGQGFQTLAGKRPAILPHDRSTVVLANPAHPGLPQFHHMKTSNAAAISGAF